MNVDRSRFLKLAVAIAATTTTTLACSSQQGEEESETGDEQAITAGGTCTAKSIREPNGGPNARLQPYAYEEGFCFDLAVHEGPALKKWDGPTAESTTTRFFDFVYDQCRMYSNQLRPAVADRVKSCLKKANDQRHRNAEGTATTEFDATKMYDCGRDALEAICKDGIDQRLSRPRCATIARILTSNGQGVDLHGNRLGAQALEDQCMAVFSGMKSSARQQVEDCVKNDKYDMWTCMEGIRSDFELAEAAELAVPPELRCTKPSASVAPPPSSKCDEVVAKAKREKETKNQFYVPEYTKSHCEAYRTKLAPAIADKAIECLLDPTRYVYDNIYTCGTEAMGSACRDASVDAACREIVSTIESKEKTILGHAKPTVNAGGRITRQCRTLFAGMTATTRDEVKRCVPDLAKQFAEADRGSANQDLIKYSFYSCVEGL